MRLIIIILIISFLSACARPVGDFGRAEVNVLNDEILPGLGSVRAMANKEPVSNLNKTDEENEMHDRVWRFLIAPHAKDWFFDIVIEWSRTRIVPLQDQRFAIDRYYYFLRNQKFSSSRVRYTALSRDIAIDLKTVSSVFASICAVREIDRRRKVALNYIASANQIERNAVNARKVENELFISWFVRSLRYRYDSYSFALDRLLIETPHEEARQVDARLSEMIIDVERAERQDFCASQFRNNSALSKPKIASRLQGAPFSQEIIYKK